MSNSVFLKTYIELVENGFFGDTEPRKFLSFSLDIIEKHIKQRHGVLLLAPPGMGKTSLPYIIVHANYGFKHFNILRVLHVLPLRSIIDDVYERFGEGLKRIGLNIANPVCRQYNMVHESPYLQSLYTVLTFDMYVYNFFKLPIEELWKIEKEISYGHYELPRSGVYSALNFFDEAHLMLEKLDIGAGALRTILYHLQRTETPYILATATLSEAFRRSLEFILKDVYVIDYSGFIRSKGPDEFYVSEVEKNMTPISRLPVKVKNSNDIVELVDKCSEESSKFLLVVNTVRKAIEIYEKLRNRKPLLLHSRFTLEDRIAKLKLLKNSKIAISTQVIEAGIDESFDTVLAELAPISSLVQRFGRMARGNLTYGKWGIFYDDESLQGSGIYDAELVRKTLNTILNVKGNIHWHLPVILNGNRKYVGYSTLLNKVWEDTRGLLYIDQNFLEILESFSVSSKDVVRYLMRLGSFVREDVLCTVYIGVPPDDYWKYVEELDHKAVFMGLSEAYHYVKRLLRKEVEVHFIKYVRGDKIDTIDFRELRGISEEKLKSKILTREILAIVVPSDFYEGGVYGVGLKQ